MEMIETVILLVKIPFDANDRQPVKNYKGNTKARQCIRFNHTLGLDVILNTFDLFGRMCARLKYSQHTQFLFVLIRSKDFIIRLCVGRFWYMLN